MLAVELERTLLPTLAAVAAGQCVVPRAIRQIVVSASAPPGDGSFGRLVEL